ncbi:MAG: helix-turn-helix domain-containing protein [Mycobacterium sp.]
MTQTTTVGDSWPQRQTLQIGVAIRALRGRRSTAWLSDATAELGERVGRSTITDIEIGRRKYVAVHELSLIAGALGVSPAALLVHGAMPDGEVEFLPGRGAAARRVAGWWGGDRDCTPPAPARDTAGPALPVDAESAALFGACRQRARLRTSLTRQLVLEEPLPEAIAAVRRQIAAVEDRIRDLGGTVGGDVIGHGDVAALLEEEDGDAAR